MRIIRWTISLVVIAVLAWFAARNWTPVTVNLVPPTQIVLPLPLLVFALLILGAVPPSLAHAFDKWRWQRRVRKAEAAASAKALELAELRGDRERQMPLDEAEAVLRARAQAAGAASGGDMPVQARSIALPPGA